MDLRDASASKKGLTKVRTCETKIDINIVFEQGNFLVWLNHTFRRTRVSHGQGARFLRLIGRLQHYSNGKQI